MFKYKEWKFKPFIYMFVGMFFLFLSSIGNLLGRFIPIYSYSSVRTILSIAESLFYLGTFTIIFSFLSVQIMIPLIRIIIYAFIYGMMVQLHLSSEFYVEFYVESNSWFTNFHSFNYIILNYITSVPTIDILIYVILRYRKGFINTKSKQSVFIFFLGILFPLLTFILPMELFGVIGFILSNFSFTIAMIFFTISFLLDPLVFVLSKAKISEIYLLRSDRGDIPVAIYSWREDEIKLSETSQALAGIKAFLENFIQSDEETQDIHEIMMGEDHIIIENSTHFSGIFIGTNLDRICRIALKRLTQLYDEKYGELSGIEASKTINEKEFAEDVENIFSFISPR
ncbi:MAG: hypothetical protein GF317_15235 [Candidatus Lokiarchaeota archaeon]|nr:hypothetical protein [Candidatus Lokiarchaeota archaeon]MBD3200928.1 hypothetical protein [Candidatus Lokiarchaeota archaeon]